MAHASELGETVLEEVDVGEVGAQASAPLAAAGFDDDDDVVEEEIEDFGLDDIKVPVIDLGKTESRSRDTAADDKVDGGLDTDASEDDKSPPDEERS